MLYISLIFIPEHYLFQSRLSASPGNGRCATPLVNAESAENKLRHVVYRNWKNIQKYCRECDSEGSGQIHPNQFKCQ